MDELLKRFELLDIEDLGSADIVVDSDARGQSGHMGCNSCIHPTCRHSLTFTAVCACPDDHCDGVLVLDVNSKPHWKLACNTCAWIMRFKGTASAAAPTVSTAMAAVASAAQGKRDRHGGVSSTASAAVDGSNNASTMIHNVSVDVSGEHCAECGDRLLSLELHRDYRGVLHTAALTQAHNQGAAAAAGSDGGVVYKGCVICDQRLQSHIDMIAGRSVSLVVLRQQRERRIRMGGRGRGGRGRGRGGRGKRMTKEQVLMSFSDF